MPKIALPAGTIIEAGFLKIPVGNNNIATGNLSINVKATTANNTGLALASNGPFTASGTANTTPAAPTIIADDGTNTLDATHTLGDSEILVSVNDAAYAQFDGLVINVGDIARAAGYWKFKIKAATGRNESPVASSPAFTVAGTVYNLSASFEGAPNGQLLSEYQPEIGNKITNYTGNILLDGLGNISVPAGSVITLPLPTAGDINLQIGIVSYFNGGSSHTHVLIRGQVELLCNLSLDNGLAELYIRNTLTNTILASSGSITPGDKDIFINVTGETYFITLNGITISAVVSGITGGALEIKAISNGSNYELLSLTVN